VAVKAGMAFTVGLRLFYLFIPLVRPGLGRGGGVKRRAESLKRQGVQLCMGVFESPSRMPGDSNLTRKLMQSDGCC
jgi:hypothetical protein